MKDSIIPQQDLGLVGAAPGFLERLARSGMLAKLARITQGEVLLRDRWGEHRFGQKTADFPRTIELTVHSPEFYTFSAFEGSVGAGEAYIRGAWTCSDLVALCRVMVANRAVIESLESGITARLGLRVLKVLHALRRNTREGSRRNIEAHYDLGNDFYRLWLDPSMTYSSGIFPHEGASMEEASIAKYDRLCRKLQLKPTDHVLEIGTGWGGFALHAATRYGCRVTTTTISNEQHKLAAERIAAAGLTDRITLLKSDYRALEGQYDKIVSIEMIEAVGWQYYETFMATCARLLKPEGIMAMQAITIQDGLYESARNSVDFIQRFIFPGSCIPSVTALCSAGAKASDLRLVHLEEIGSHYARTLATWREAFFSKLPEIRAMGFDDRFIRMWEFYLCYCEGGFAQRNVGCAQLLFARSAWQQPVVLPKLD